jgi:vancomycin resistance protein VanJ
MVSRIARERAPRWSWKLTVTLAVAAWVAWCAGQVFRDRSWLSGMCFYLPSPVIGAFLFASSILVRRRSRWAALSCIVLSLVPSLAAALVENHWTPARAPAKAAYRIVHWNITSGILGWDAVVETLAGLRADAYVLSEPPRGARLMDLAGRLGPDYRTARFGCMAFVARGAFRENGWLADSDLRVQSLTWNPDGAPLEVLAVDLESNVLVARDPLLRTLIGILEAHGPDIAVGDFNAPRRSEALCPLPGAFRHAYEVAGSGWSYTWPVPLPVYAIDQCIVGERIAPVSYELVSTFRSDHRLQVLDFDFDPGSSVGGQ